MSWIAEFTDEGKEIFKEIFPNGKVMIESPIPSKGFLGDTKTEFYEVQWKFIHPDSKILICEHIGKKNNVDPGIIYADFRDKGTFPIRKELLHPVAIPLRYFL